MLVVLATALLVSLGAVYITAQLRGHADRERQAVPLFARLEAQAYRLSSLEWQAVAERRLSPEVTEEVQDAKSEISSVLDELTRLDLDVSDTAALSQVEEALSTYEEATDEEFRLLEAGQPEQAIVVDEEQVDPSFEELREVLQETSSTLSAHAQRQGRLADIGSALTLLSAAGLIGLLFWLFERARRSAELLRVENLEVQAARLQQSNRELQDFVRIASHDLQEPLRKVRTFGDRLKIKYAGALDDRGRDYLERMDGVTARMQDIIDDLLALSRIDTRARPFEPVNLTEVANEVLSDLETRIEEAGGRVEVGELPTVEADQSQMRQLLQNLIGNALKFHKQGEAPVVKVHGKVLEEREKPLDGSSADDEAWQVIVEDNGVGFEEKYLEFIFAPFQRLHSRDAYKGTGMGLAICRRVVERHGGEITAKSATGQGATFIVTLPAKQSEKETRTARGKADEHATAGR